MNQFDGYWGFLQYKKCLVPTWRGFLLLMLLSIGFITLAVFKVHSFLAVTETVATEVLVVEGWVPDYILEETMAEFKRGHYRKLYVTGGPIERGGVLSEYKTYAELGAATLIKMGMNNDELEAVPSLFVQQDRTYTSALALRNRLRRQSMGDASINLVSEGAHSRRSRLLFQDVFGEDSSVGIIAVEDRSYNPRRWWEFSAGVRAVVDESFAYVYARIIFPFLTPV